MNKHSLLILLAALTFSYSKDGRTFTYGYEANSTYEQSVISSDSSSTTYSGSQRFLSELKKNNVPVHLAMTERQNLVAAITTGPKHDDGHYDFLATVKKYEAHRAVNGREIEGLSAHALKNLAATARLHANDGGALHEITINGIAATLHAAVRPVVENMALVFTFPDSALHPGDSFKQSTEMDLPVPGFQSVKTKLSTIYTLVRADDAAGVFTVSTALELLPYAKKDIDIAVTGSGGGVLKHNRQSTVFDSYRTTLEITTTIETGQFNMHIITRSESTIKQKKVR
ncbi:MAG: hypothetical protein JXA71_18450 [Chitinispirillaceae bacterium]|nr:hypothetical protein [Chitinispirillaceae bacterium]